MAKGKNQENGKKGSELESQSGGGNNHENPIKYTFFFKKDSPFSQHHPSKFERGDIEFNTAEQYMMYRKAMLFEDFETAGRILKSSEPKDQKDLGRQVRGFDEKIWAGKREEIVYKGNHAKFMQNLEMYEALMGTRDTTLVEASPYDLIWGVGLTAEDPNILNKENWKGQNLLGKILTKLRDDLYWGMKLYLEKDIHRDDLNCNYKVVILERKLLECPSWEKGEKPIEFDGRFMIFNEQSGLIATIYGPMKINQMDRYKKDEQGVMVKDHSLQGYAVMNGKPGRGCHINFSTRSGKKFELEWDFHHMRDYPLATLETDIEGLMYGSPARVEFRGV